MKSKSNNKNRTKQEIEIIFGLVRYNNYYSLITGRCIYESLIYDVYTYVYNCLYVCVCFFFFLQRNSYGLVLGTGAGLVRETAGLVLGHYFRRRREFVEMVVQAGTGVGIALFSVFYKEAVG